MDTSQRGLNRVNQYLFLSYLVTLVNMYGYLSAIKWSGPAVGVFTVAAYLSYALIYLSPVIAVVWLVDALVRLSARIGWGAQARLRWGLRLQYALALVGASLVQAGIYADKTIFHIFGMHFNGFIWNVISTPGGIDSMDSSGWAMVDYAAFILGLVAVQVLVLLVVLYFRPLHRVWPRLFNGWVRAALFGLVVVVGLGQQFVYGLSHMKSYAPVLVSAQAFPFYISTTFQGTAKKLGFDITRQHDFQMDQGEIQLKYPLKPLVVHKPDKPMNIVWLACESLRWDMLDPQIMPKTWAFSQRARRYTYHYSGGNGTRMGVFTMFYGLYGNYWFSFLNEHQGPVLIDVLRDQNYQMQMYTSAGFNYPEFDKTVFGRIPSDDLHPYQTGQGWERDRVNVKRIMSFIDGRDRSRPFMTFMFFESSHARYFFPEESVIRRPYLKEFNYATADFERDIGLIKNRYINASHHLDSQIGRMIDYLDKTGLMDNTIVLITGDHGEEFMEKGRWGHNSRFTEEQTRTPFVLWVPGVKPAVVDDMTSHLDIPATILPLLGVTNPPEDYSLGYDLLGDKRRDYTVIADWSRIAYVGPRYKAVFPVTSGGFTHDPVTDHNDQPVNDASGFYRLYEPRLVEVLKGMSKFSR
jgi:uncharacterized protein